MDCDFCGKEFDIPSTGSGGKNRLFCFNCLPAGLTRKDRTSIRDSLYARRMKRHKESIGCKVCGYNVLGSALEWHHPNDDKIDEAANIIKRSWSAYIEETDKCVLLCSNHHKEVHAGIISV